MALGISAIMNICYISNVSAHIGSFMPTWGWTWWEYEVQQVVWQDNGCSCVEKKTMISIFSKCNLLEEPISPWNFLYHAMKDCL